MKRTHHCAQLTPADLGASVALSGWVDSVRDHGGIIFIDLRDRKGITQVKFDPQDNAELGVQAGHRILDLGCGSGRLASMLSPTRLSSYLGVDISAEGLRRARALHLSHGHFELGDFETWRPTEAFDVITFNECLGYARRPVDTAVAMARHLKPGGVLIVSHFRWGNHEAIWRSLGQVFTVTAARTASNLKGQIWDLKSLRLRD